MIQRRFDHLTQPLINKWWSLNMLNLASAESFMRNASTIISFSGITRDEVDDSSVNSTALQGKVMWIYSLIFLDVVCVFWHLGVQSSARWVIVLKENLLTKLALQGKSPQSVCWLCFRAPLHVKQIWFCITIFQRAVSTVVAALSSKSAFSLLCSLDDVHHPTIPRLTPTTRPPHPPLVSLSPYDTSLLTRSTAGPHSNQTFLLTPGSLCVTDLRDVPPDTCTHAETHAAGCTWTHVHLLLACRHLIHGQPSAQGRKTNL